MIESVFDFFCKEINAYAQLNVPGIDTPNSFCQIGNISALTGEGGSESWSVPVTISLLNIEEDRVAKSQDSYFRMDDKVFRANPKVPLNLYCLFAVKGTLSQYTDTLLYLSHIIRFFQYNNVFTPAEFKNLDPGIEKLIADIHNMTFDQQNQMWAYNGNRYFPSIVYKIRMIEIFAGPKEESGIITNINIQEN